MINKMKSILGITTALLTSTVHYVLSQNNMMERDSIIKETDSINMNIKQVNNDKLVIRLGARNFIWARGFWSFMTRLDILYPYNKPAAGYTTKELPTTIKTSAVWTISMAFSIIGTGSPNHTICGLN